VRGLYPPDKPFRVGHLTVSRDHRIYYEEFGTPRGKPAVVLHGGPGYGLDRETQRFFDLRSYRVVLFDQRGCGKSQARATLRDNTTWHLVEDIEALRRHVGVDKWLVFGGSWGSTLALAYSQQFPSRVEGMILRGVFLLRRSEVAWFYENPWGAAAIYPDLWERFVAAIPHAERQDLLTAYYRRLTSPNRATVLRAARAWSTWEAATSYLRHNDSHVRRFKTGLRTVNLARIECHYFVNRGFFRRDGQLLHDIELIRQIPTVIVQGRYDIVCPPRSAWDLHKVWPEAELRMVADAGHSAFEPGTCRELVRATESFVRGRD